MPVFVWLLLCAIGVFALQLFPPTGIYLMFLGGGIVTGWLILLAIAALFFEALSRRVPRWLVVFPVITAGGYYALVAYERLNLPALPAKAGVEQIAGGLIFDPQQHGIEQRGVDPNYLLARYQVPRVYDTSFSRVRTIGETRSCEMLSYHGSKRNRPNAPVGISIDALDQVFCFSFVDTTTGNDALITFERRYSESVVDGIETQVDALTLLLDGREVGRISNLSAKVLPLFPFVFAGCGLNSGTTSWDCSVQVVKTQVWVWPNSSPSYSLALRRAFETDQVAELLSLTPRSAEELDAMTRLADAD